MLSKKQALLLLLLTVFSVQATYSQDWPQYLGPNRDSKSPQKRLLRAWPEDGPQVLWSVPLGAGYGGPVAKDGKVYLLDRDDDAGDTLKCFDLRTGQTLWTFGYASPGALPYPGSRSVPIVDDERVYACGPNGDLYAVDIKTHRPVWHKNVWTDFGGAKLPMWGISQNPILHGEMLIISSQAPNAGVVAYNKRTGALIWHTKNLGNENYVSPKLLNICGDEQVVMVNSSTNTYVNKNTPVTKGCVVGLDPKTGNELWRYANWECVISIPCPVPVGDGRLLIVGGYDRGATMIKVSKNSDGTFNVAELFTTLSFGDQTKPPLFLNSYFYAMYRTNSRRDGLMCMDVNGKIMWKTGRNPNFDRGSMVYADGLLLATDGMKLLYLIEPSPDSCKVLAKADVLSKSPIVSAGPMQNWAPLALADGLLLVRDQGKMVCVRVAE